VMAGSGRGPRARIAAAAAVFAVVGSVAAYSASRPAQLGSLGGVTDEYFALGAKLRVNGTLGVARNEPSALRPPGYPAFVAVVLAAFVESPSVLAAREFEARGRRALYLSQAALLAMAAVVLYLWLSGRVRGEAAAIAALVFGLNPHSLVLTGLSHYGVLHSLLLVLSCAATDAALRSRFPARALVGAGLLWGASNLVRPVTLLFPAFLFVVLCLWGKPVRRAALPHVLALSLGMALALAPWTLRNYRLTGRLVAVADNPWATLWGQTVKPLRPDPGHYVWFDLYEKDLMPIFTRVTGSPSYDYVLQNRCNAELEAEFRREALRNVRERPTVYLGNAAAALWSYSVQTSAVFLTAYRELQAVRPASEPPGESPPKAPQAWFRAGESPPALAGGLARAYAAFVLLLSVLAVGGVWSAARRRSDVVLGPLAAWVCVAATQALVFLHLMHYYSKMPFLLVGVACLVDALVARDRWRCGWPAALGLLAACLALTVWTLSP